LHTSKNCRIGIGILYLYFKWKNLFQASFYYLLPSRSLSSQTTLSPLESEYSFFVFKPPVQCHTLYTLTWVKLWGLGKSYRNDDFNSTSSTASTYTNKYMQCFARHWAIPMRWVLKWARNLFKREGTRSTVEMWPIQSCNYNFYHAVPS
jgi:hypothetical protein